MSRSRNLKVRFRSEKFSPMRYEKLYYSYSKFLSPMPGARGAKVHKQSFVNSNFRINRFFTDASKPFIFMSPTRGFVHPYSKHFIFFENIIFFDFYWPMSKGLFYHTGLQPINTGLIHAKLSFCQCPKVYSMSNRSTTDQLVLLFIPIPNF